MAAGHKTATGDIVWMSGPMKIYYFHLVSEPSDILIKSKRLQAGSIVRRVMNCYDTYPFHQLCILLFMTLIALFIIRVGTDDIFDINSRLFFSTSTFFIVRSKSPLYFLI